MKIGVAWVQIVGSPAARASGPIGNEIQDLVIGPSGALWVATNSGLSRFSNGRFRHFTRRNGMPHDQVFTLVAVQRGVFAGTNAGLVWFDDLAPSQMITPLIIREARGTVNSIFEYQGDFLFLLSPKYQDSKIGRIGLNQDGTPAEESSIYYELSTKVRRLLPVAENRVLLEVLPERRWKRCELPKSGDIPDLQAAEFYYPILIDAERAGNASFILTDRELFRQTGVQLKGLGAISSSDGFLDLDRDRNRLWLGEKGHLWLFNLEREEESQHFKLPPGITPKAIAEELNGRLWVGTENNGLLMAVPNRKLGWGVPSARAVINFRYNDFLFR